MRRSSLLVFPLLVALALPAHGHYPVSLSAKDAQANSSRILVDGTISYAVTAIFTQSGQNRHFRFKLEDGQKLEFQYLILDKSPTNKLNEKKLPLITITSPENRTVRVKVNERRPFYEPYSKESYLYLARYSADARSGIYRISARSRAKSSIVLAVGTREVAGEIIEVGNQRGLCPATRSGESEISRSRGEQLLGMSEGAAMVCAEANRWIYRLGSRDDEYFPVTMDYRPDRVTVSVKLGRIDEVNVG